MPRLPRRSDVRLLDRSELVKTGPLDQADWSYRPVLGWVQQLRFRAVTALLATVTEGRLLEVGYGSGIFLPELARHCRQLVAVDVHPRGAEVRERLTATGVDAALGASSSIALPFADDSFDTVVTVSTLEFVSDVGLAVAELLRVTRSGGRLIAVTPGRSPLLDLGLRVLSGERAEDTFQGRRQQVIPAFEERASAVEAHTLPRLTGRVLPLYTVLVARPG